jgi:MFS family permease
MSALRDRRFRRLLVGQSLSSFGDSALYLSLAIWAKDLTGSNAAAGAVFFALGLPILFAPLAGQLVDRVNRRRLLITANAAAGVGVLALLAVQSRAQLWIIYAVAAGYGVTFALLSAARSGLLKDLVPAEDLAAANASFQAIGQGLRLASPLVGAGIYSAVGGGALAMLDAATFAAAVIALASIQVQESPPDPGPRQRFRQELTAGFQHLRHTAVLGRVALTVAVAFSVLGFLESTDFAVIEHGLHRPPSFFGVLNSVQGAGSILGGLTAALVLRRLGEARTVGLALATDGAGALALTQARLPVVLAGFVIMGVAVSWLLVGYATARQRLTPPRLQGRVASATDVLINGPQTASIALGAVLIDLVDYRILLLVIAGVLLACGGMLGIRLRQAPGDRQPQAGRPEMAPNDHPA